MKEESSRHERKCLTLASNTSPECLTGSARKAGYTVPSLFFGYTSTASKDPAGSVNNPVFLTRSR